MEQGTEAEVIEETPGIGIILILFSTQAFKSTFPGSDSNGVPASDIKDKILPLLMWLNTLLMFFFSLNL